MKEIGTVKELDNNTREVLEYGLYILFSEMVKMLVFIVIAVILNILQYALFSLLCYALLRIFAGGIHSKTWIGCLISSSTIFFLTVYLSLMIPFSGLYLHILQTCIYLLCMAILLKYAPSDHENKPIASTKQRKRLKKISLLIFNAIFIVSLFLPQPYGKIAILSLLAECVFILPVIYWISGNKYGSEYRGDKYEYNL
ncbi:MAG: accessory gene regulator B family protein [Clostridia bacterium]|nr:accessory gene regulator B family protein [Clostridia bacterium]